MTSILKTRIDETQKKIGAETAPIFFMHRFMLIRGFWYSPFSAVEPVRDVPIFRIPPRTRRGQNQFRFSPIWHSVGFRPKESSIPLDTIDRGYKKSRAVQWLVPPLPHRVYSWLSVKRGSCSDQSALPICA